MTNFDHVFAEDLHADLEAENNTVCGRKYKASMERVHLCVKNATLGVNFETQVCDVCPSLLETLLGDCTLAEQNTPIIEAKVKTIKRAMDFLCHGKKWLESSGNASLGLALIVGGSACCFLCCVGACIYLLCCRNKKRGVDAFDEDETEEEDEEEEEYEE
jgi:hypothetical protein